ncbi:hypothetical protein [Azotobacter chroococcum]|uniref:Uncharacterized protein n=1 Tax=Azotobacter chroococcum NCIMB 8003 TaxID=1328314 RepID=A0A0C4WM40_9GAMM|nr:hypothetical protein [Azotobacter chroococcum]AJE23878.1 Hypothetical protein Achr_f1840 [Azotobacter chroococcum NCIMB 8003]
MVIVNLTQHPASPEQLAAGVYDLAGEELALLKGLLTFDEIPSKEEIEAMAADLAELAMLGAAPGDDDGNVIPTAAMIGGAPFLMGALERALTACAVRPLYAFSRRESVEEVQPDGSVRKTAVFLHQGFVEV